MYLHRILTPGLGINSYILGDKESKRAVVVDPTRQVVPYIVKAQEEGLNITDILETHVHADFVSGARELKHQLNDKPIIHCSGMGGKEWVPHYADHQVQHGDKLFFGKIRLEALHTPGHTPEHLCWVCYDESRSQESPWFLFSGDCLFVESVGRPDLLGEKESRLLAKKLYHSLFDVLGSLPDFVEILPGHGSGSLCGKSLSGAETSTMGYERRYNRYMNQISEEEWIEGVLRGLPPVPRYFKKLKKINVQGPPLMSSLKAQLFDPQIQKRSDLFLVDIRLPEGFAISHLPGSLNIPFSQTFHHWAGHFLPEEQPIGIVTENTHIMPEVVNMLHMIGFDQEISIILFDPKESSLSSFAMMDPNRIDQKIGEVLPVVVDVRTDEEWEAGHIPQALHMELDELENRITELNKESPTVLLCRSGMRASTGASLLKKAGFTSVFNLRGGMQAWKMSQ
jgi:hydroxyacylglutathione hydrolase